MSERLKGTFSYVFLALCFSQNRTARSRSFCQPRRKRIFRCWRKRVRPGSVRQRQRSRRWTSRTVRRMKNRVSEKEREREIILLTIWPDFLRCDLRASVIPTIPIYRISQRRRPRGPQDALARGRQFGRSGAFGSGALREELPANLLFYPQSERQRVRDHRSTRARPPARTTRHDVIIDRPRDGRPVLYK